MVLAIRLFSSLVIAWSLGQLAYWHMRYVGAPESMAAAVAWGIALGLASLLCVLWIETAIND